MGNKIMLQELSDEQLESVVGGGILYSFNHDFNRDSNSFNNNTVASFNHSYNISNSVIVTKSVVVDSSLNNVTINSGNTF